jgi:hypothetical protein
MCLGKSGHGLVSPQHPVVAGPRKVELKYKAIPYPYEKTPSGMPPPKTIEAFDVQTEEPTKKNGMLYGLVSSPGGFTDSPDTEVICGGVNTKGEDAVAVGRHGSFLSWGFDAPPSYLTDTGKSMLVNAITYTAKFDRMPVLVRQVSQPRSAIDQTLNSIKNVRAEYDAIMERINQEKKRGKELAEAKKTRKLTDEEEEFLKNGSPDFVDFEEYNKMVYEQFPKELQAKFKNDPAKYTAYYKENRPYLVGQGYSHILDADAKKLGVGNSDPKFLPRCLQELDNVDQKALALILLQRYTGETFEKIEEWKTWYESTKADLFFSEVGGFRWYSRADPLETIRRRIIARTLPEVTAGNPVSINAEITSQAYPGERVTVAVRMRIASGWYIYAKVPDGKPGTPTSFGEELPKGLAWDGDWIAPKPIALKDGVTVHRGDMVFLRHARVVADHRPGNVEMATKVAFQVCNNDRCLKPKTETVPLKVEVKTKPKSEFDE